MSVTFSLPFSLEKPLVVFEWVMCFFCVIFGCGSLREGSDWEWMPGLAEQTLSEEREEEEEELERMVAFEDIRDCLFSITSESALCHLVGHFLEFCNLSLPHW
jgi:hypothetical protein